MCSNEIVCLALSILIIIGLTYLTSKSNTSQKFILIPCLIATTALLVINIINSKNTKTFIINNKIIYSTLIFLIILIVLILYGYWTHFKDSNSDFRFMSGQIILAMIVIFTLIILVFSEKAKIDAILPIIASIASFTVGKEYSDKLALNKNILYHKEEPITSENDDDFRNNENVE